MQHVCLLNYYGCFATYSRVRENVMCVVSIPRKAFEIFIYKFQLINVTIKEPMICINHGTKKIPIFFHGLLIFKEPAYNCPVSVAVLDKALGRTFLTQLQKLINSNLMCID